MLKAFKVSVHCATMAVEASVYSRGNDVEVTPNAQRDADLYLIVK
jgi:hypothetical protein